MNNNLNNLKNKLKNLKFIFYNWKFIFIYLSIYHKLKELKFKKDKKHLMMNKIEIAIINQIFKKNRDLFFDLIILI